MKMETMLTQSERQSWLNHIKKIFGIRRDIYDILVNDMTSNFSEFRSSTNNRQGRFLMNYDGKITGCLPPLYPSELQPVDEGEAISNFHITDLTVSQFVERCEKEKLSPVGAADMVFRLPNLMLFSKIFPNYYLYRISFVPEVGTIQDNTMNAVWNGYYGVTSRSPFERFKEHQKNAMCGGGHLLHRTWGALLRSQPNTTIVFSLVACAKSLKEIYKLEEQAVAAHTLNPKGLNAIPGGEAGIKVLHELSLLKNKNIVDCNVRDAALVALDREYQTSSKCTHYRRGHIRKLKTGNLTWVSSCWINKDKNIELV